MDIGRLSTYKKEQVLEAIRYAHAVLTNEEIIEATRA